VPERTAQSYPCVSLSGRARNRRVEPEPVNEGKTVKRDAVRRRAALSQVFDSLETSIRTLVAESLRAEDGEDWWNGGRIPQGIKNAAEANRQREIESGMTPRSDDLLDFTTFGELSRTAARWPRTRLFACG